LAGPERGEHPAKKQKLETAEMSLTSINPTAPHKGRQPQTQTLRQRKPSLVRRRFPTSVDVFVGNPGATTVKRRSPAIAPGF